MVIEEERAGDFRELRVAVTFNQGVPGSIPGRPTKKSMNNICSPSPSTVWRACTW